MGRSPKHYVAGMWKNQSQIRLFMFNEFIEKSINLCILDTSSSIGRYQYIISCCLDILHGCVS